MPAIAEHSHEVLRTGRTTTRDHRCRGRTRRRHLTLTCADDGAGQRCRAAGQARIRPWTTDYVRMRVLGDPDVLLPGDRGPRRGCHGRTARRPSRPHRLGSASRPWRSYLTAHLAGEHQ